MAERTDFYRRWQFLKSDRQGLARTLHDELLDSYEGGLADQMRALGLDDSVELSNKAIIRRLKGEANRYAVSMHRTYNRELKRKLASLEASGELSEANVKEWFNGWQDRKADQAAAQTELSGYNQAAVDFAQRNQSKLTGEARIGPSVAGEPRCAALLSRNPYKIEEIGSVGLPLHIGCIHSWSSKYTLVEDVNPEALWAGGLKR